MPDGNATLFTVTDLKQFSYCPRILFYQVCLPDVRPITLKMEMGQRRHEDEPKRALRRNMRLEGIHSARREFDVSVQSEELGLSGQIDEVLVFDDGLMVVDYKLAKTAGQHFKVQLAAYAMLAEATYDLPVLCGILYLIRKREAVEVTISTRLRNQVRRTLDEMRQIAATETMPAPTPNRRACVDCEFRRFCNDV
jgi:CRISPR-associated exonuclease Cas4